MDATGTTATWRWRWRAGRALRRVAAPGGLVDLAPRHRRRWCTPAPGLVLIVPMENVTAAAVGLAFRLYETGAATVLDAAA